MQRDKNKFLWSSTPFQRFRSRARSQAVVAKKIRNKDQCFSNSKKRGSCQSFPQEPFTVINSSNLNLLLPELVSFTLESNFLKTFRQKLKTSFQVLTAQKCFCFTIESYAKALLINEESTKDSANKTGKARSWKSWVASFKSVRTVTAKFALNQMT